ncbi:hypothetical protein [Vermiculatibacterium agrestimuris]|uniref:hypothetical protein n=1 Tax=Vermiculatibacterium agrestimuris TaxID=2941519 RepID=UPI0020425A95|nr:hypothetical protein [Vermiculatibacterium agrestimuris]
MSKSENTHKMTIRLSPLAKYRLEVGYQQDGSRSKNDFIERAVLFYLDHLEAEHNGMLPVAIQSAIDGRLGMFEDRLAKLLFKQTVETDMGLSVLLEHLGIDPDYLKKLRAESVKNVKATNGRVTFEQKAQEQYDEGEDDLWQD